MKGFKTTAPVIQMLGLDYLPEPLVDKSVNGITYYGYAPLGTDESDLGWLIIRAVTANKVTTIEYAQPDPEGFVHSWTQRETYFHSSHVLRGYLYNGEFYADSAHTTALAHSTEAVYIDTTSGVGYMWNGSAFVASEGGGSGDYVTRQELANYQRKLSLSVESHTIAASDWSSMSGNEPYAYSAEVILTGTISSDSIIELINDQAVNFAKYGFAIGDRAGQSIKMFAMTQPAIDVTLKINIY